MNVSENGPVIPELPDKVYFKIGEVAELVGVKPYILRYWESEFKALSPRKTQSRHRKYQHDDIILLFHIKHLLYDRMFTIAGARKQLHTMIREGRLLVGTTVTADEFEFDSNEDGSSVSGALFGAETDVAEQEIMQLRADVEQLRGERDEALETAQIASEAIREVEDAQSSLAQRLEAEQALREAAEETVEVERGHTRAAKEEVRRLRTSLEDLQMSLDALRAERDALLESHKAAAATSDAEDPEALARETEEAWMKQAQQAALQEAQRGQRELRRKLDAQAERQRQLLEALHQEAARLVGLVSFEGVEGGGGESEVA